jgi:hypothetical protein
MTGIQPFITSNLFSRTIGYMCGWTRQIKMRSLSLLKPLNQQHLNRTLVPRRCHGGTSQRIA